MGKESSHITKEQIEQLVTNSLNKAERRKVVRHLLSRCKDCIKLAGQILFPASVSYDYSGVIRRLGLSYLVAKNEIEEERTYAREEWEHFLSRLDAGQRLRAIRDNPMLQTWGIFDLLIAQAKKVVRDTPLEAVDLAHAAVYISEKLPVERYGPERTYDFRAGAYAALGNIKRLIGDFDGAGEALRIGQDLLDSGTGDPYEEANLLSMLASLHTDLGQFEAATDILSDAIALAREVEDEFLEAKLRIQESSSIGWVDPARGLHLAHIGLRQLHESKKVDTFIQLAGVHLTALWSNELGYYEEARATLETYRYLYDLHPDTLTRGRLLHLEGLISRKERRLDQSERFLKALAELYAEHGMEFDLALAVLEWAESLVLLGRFDEAGAAMHQVYPLIESWNIHIDVLRAWLLTSEAIRGKAIQEAGFRELAMTLRRKWFRKGNGDEGRNG